MIKSAAILFAMGLGSAVTGHATPAVPVSEASPCVRHGGAMRVDFQLGAQAQFRCTRLLATTQVAHPVHNLHT